MAEDSEKDSTDYPFMTDSEYRKFFNRPPRKDTDHVFEIPGKEEGIAETNRRQGRVQQRSLRLRTGSSRPRGNKTKPNLRLLNCSSERHGGSPVRRLCWRSRRSSLAFGTLFQMFSHK